ncbi:MAG: hypothetical protein ABL977_00610 [Candidatus Eisenbacteria bacterium]
MTLLRAIDVPPPRSAPRETHVSITALLVALLWFDVLWETARHGEPAAFPPLAVAALGLASQLLFCAFEAVLARAAWQLAGHTPRWEALATRILAASSAEAFAVSIAAGGTPLPGWLAQLLAGARAAPLATPDAGLAFAFAGFGVLALVRMALSAQQQARLVRAPFAHGAAVVLALWFATRLMMWWSSELARGRSYQPWGS